MQPWLPATLGGFSLLLANVELKAQRSTGEQEEGGAQQVLSSHKNAECSRRDFLRARFGEEPRLHRKVAFSFPAHILGGVGFPPDWPLCFPASTGKG